MNYRNLDNSQLESKMMEGYELRFHSSVPGDKVRGQLVLNEVEREMKHRREEASVNGTTETNWWLQETPEVAYW